MAYASLVSLVNVLEQNLELNLISQNTEYLETFLQEASFFQDFLEKYSEKSSEKVKCLESRIRDAAYKAQNIVDAQAVDRLDEPVISLACSFEESEGDWEEYLLQRLDEVMEEINSIKQEVMQIEENGEAEDDNDEPDLQPRILSPARSLAPPSDSMVGLDDDFKQIKIQLLGNSIQREIVALVGMGGIGKTTLAKKVSGDKSIVSHFDICRWVTVSQEHNIQNIIAKLLADDEMSGENINEDLGLYFYKSLKKRRYLIVLDDVWDTKVWDDLKIMLPDDKNGSRILLTTRLEHVAKHENPRPPHRMRLLNNQESWDLFCGSIFGEYCCPPKLEKVGTEIAKNCRGLPLALKVVGGLLSKSTRTERYWRSVAENLCEAIASNDEEQVTRVLSLSYKRLPHHLKGCFLYMNIFPKDYEIKASVLVRLWIACGLIKKERSTSLEDVYEEYFLGLVDRNLILVSRRKYDGRIKRCKLHDLVRDVCVKEAGNEMFLNLTIKTAYCDFYQYRKDNAIDSPPPISRALRAMYPDEYDTNLSVRRQTNIAQALHLFSRPPTKVDLTGALTREYLHLQTLHLRFSSLAINMWEMPQLRHVESGPLFTLPNPLATKIEGENSVIVLDKLHTLYTVKNFIFTDEVLGRIPNLKKLGVCYVGENDDVTPGLRCFGLNNLERLDKLESLCCTFEGWTPVILGRDIAFPPSIKKLTLDGSRIPWKELTVIGSLPNLQVLKLKLKSFAGEEWEPNEGEFLKVKTLQLEGLNDLVHWRAEAVHFPELQHLIINSCRNLLEIPRGFGEMPTLQLIKVCGCRESIAPSARKIEEEQREFGNEGFQLIIYNCFSFL